MKKINLFSQNVEKILKAYAQYFSVARSFGVTERIIQNGIHPCRDECRFGVIGQRANNSRVGDYFYVGLII
jgi:hypothetical protein